MEYRIKPLFVNLRITTLMLLTLFSVNILWAQAPSSKRTYTTVKIESEIPDIDGVPDDAVWELSGWQGDYTQWIPNEGSAPHQKTEFSILYDDEYIYAAIKLYDTEPEKIETRVARRDQWAGDCFAFQIN